MIKKSIYGQDLLPGNLTMNKIKLQNIDEVFIEDEYHDLTLTFRDVYELSDKLSLKLRDLGLRKGDYIIIKCDTCLQMFVTLFACMLYGINIIVIDPNIPVTLRENLRRKYKCQVMFEQNPEQSQTDSLKHLCINELTNQYILDKKQ